MLGSLAFRNGIGRPLYADSVTESCKRLSYARVCVEIEVGASLPSSFCLRLSSGREVEIMAKYPWKPLQCLECKVLGHSGDRCPKNFQPVVHVPHQNSLPVPQQVWVTKQHKGKAAAVPYSAISDPKVSIPTECGQPSIPSNRFAVLDSSGFVSDAALGFVEPLEVMDMGNVSLGVEDGQPLFSKVPCSDTSFSPQVAPVSAAIVVHDVSPPPDGFLFDEVSLQVSSSVDPQMPSPLLDGSRNSGNVIPSVKEWVQDTATAIEQVSQDMGRAVAIPTGLNGGPEPPGSKKVTRKNTKKR
ncbi:hypothetical protein RHSIM_RhsimUnG0077700 [Rhododendron simsii]|uniref:Zinc knuckle CX2CX4HX4C domain-containing protein n=1 Tax=Rhododendron simsii TaxID=118357 RepID=A0A834FWW7_RHOSS|nr:hypothetical protein RHSIM_RhsimUnG0077700 [Rhododendron simsii]